MTALGLGLEQQPLVLALRLAARRDPAATAARIAQLLAGPRLAAPALRVDVQVLLAELLHRCGAIHDAINAAAMAAVTAGALRPTDWPRLVTTLLVGADVALRAGHPSVFDTSASARAAASYLRGPDRERAMIAHALHDVAVFHHVDRSQGREGLISLHASTLAGSPLAQMIDSGLAAMHGRPAQHIARHGVPVPVPCGVLQPRLGPPTIGWLADRVRNARRPDPAVTS